MVNRPPPKPGMNGHSNDDSSSLRLRRGLEWSLRGLHSIDNSAQHFLQSYYDDDSGSDESEEE
eukprot:CAMPEP_0194054932 /NCGR_PEP_ID=MMETSP0009_2-20130614/55063_1 /TAXON_ID=210454 /ORGANISM="Grammatophora oceanica, Strain CCMP 410" /LENGTH=62 /DNA_ID=CAMNT_0038703653 /DNA_START=72 /DNA_END=257 /DNA_ORIENTATION=+